jgi:hypothetical protein
MTPYSIDLVVFIIVAQCGRGEISSPAACAGTDTSSNAIRKNPIFIANSRVSF